MADLRIDTPATTEAFARAMADAGVKLPLVHRASHVGVLEDESGKTVCVVDHDCEMDDDDARRIADLVLLAVNTCAGFAAVIEEPRS